MNEKWKHMIVTEISTAVYVAEGTGKTVHQNRPFHGLVLHDGVGVKDYCFDDGRVMHTEPNDLFYLPKGSSYRVETVVPSGCYAINFAAELEDLPFTVSLRNPSTVLHNFRAAANAWRRGDPFRQTAAMRAVYDAVWQLQKECTRQYMPKGRMAQIAPALEKIDQAFTSNDLTVADLAALCSVSEVYFRRLFAVLLGKSPKEYIIEKRVGYAKTLLRSGQFSVAEVASMCGYAEPCHFSREFLRRVGVSPANYRYHDCRM